VKLAAGLRQLQQHGPPVALAPPPDLPVTSARDLTAGLAAESARAGPSFPGPPSVTSVHNLITAPPG